MHKPWGQLLTLDLFGCPNELMKDVEHLRAFSKLLCAEINMTPHGDTLIDRFGEGDIEGISSMQFIKTSSITVHLDEVGGRAFIDIFSCKKFDAQKAGAFAREYFKAQDIKAFNHIRG
ncbi:MAG: S-adenosylmethionine decarboxylase [bacterium]|nr:S-adenosylmethionine decarboxylase [bacterium]